MRPHVLNWLAGALITGGFVWSTWYFGIQHGLEQCQRKQEQALWAAEIYAKEAAKNLAQGEQKHAERVRERIVYVRQTPDSAGCSEVVMPPEYLRALGGVRPESSDPAH